MVASVLAFTIASLFAVGRAAAPFPVKAPQVTTGQGCTIGWKAATSDQDSWRGFSIELMTGSNTNMVPLKTLTTGQDGTKDGSFGYTCPEVTINAPIYFYRFNPGKSGTAPNYSDRFAIASKDGHISPAPQQTQPDGSNVPWGVGALGASQPPPTTSSKGGASPTTSPPSTTTTAGGGGGGGKGGNNGNPVTTTQVITTTQNSKTWVVTRTSIINNNPAPTTVTKTVWPPAQKTTITKTTTKWTTSYVPNYITVTQTKAGAGVTATTTATVTVNTGTPSANNKRVGSAASKQIPFVHLLTVVIGSVIACVTLLG